MSDSIVPNEKIQKQLNFLYHCSSCDTVTKIIQKTGADIVAEKDYPQNTPTSQRCSDCGNWAFYSRATITDLEKRL